MRNKLRFRLFVILCMFTSSLYAQDGGYLKLDGADDNLKITKTSSGALGITDEITMSFWAKGDNTAVSGLCLTKVDQAESLVVLMPNAATKAYFAKSFGDRTVSSTAFVKDEWHHWVFVRKFAGTNSADNFSRIYRDGVDVSLNANTEVNIPTFSGTTEFIFGEAGSASGTKFKGQVDEFRLWKKALTAPEAMQVKNGEAVAEADLLCNLKFEDVSNPALDSKANSTVTVEATGNPVVEPAPQPLPNASLRCLELDGVDDYLNVSGSRLGEITDKITLAFWAKFDPLEKRNCIIGAQNGTKLNVFLSLGGTNKKVYWDAPYYFSDSRVISAVYSKNEWAYWCFVKDQTTGTMTIYKDGEVFNNKTKKTRGLSGISHFFIGRNGRSPIDWYKGQIDEFRLWKTALTKPEINKAMNAVNVQTDNMLLYMSFEDEANPFKNSVTNSGLAVTPSGNPQTVALPGSAGIVTPVYGVEIARVDNELKWSVDFEDAVVSYNVEKRVNGVWTTVTAVAAKGEPNSNYSVVVGEGEFRITAVDGSGFSQSFASEHTKKAFINLSKGWNLISVPFEDTDLSNLKQQGTLWTWNGTAYEKSEKVNALEGLWVFSPTAIQLTLTGTKVADATVVLFSGWNLVGPAENCKVPVGLKVFSWETTYQQILDTSASLIQGHGYWIFSDKKTAVKLGL